MYCINLMYFYYLFLYLFVYGIFCLSINFGNASLSHMALGVATSVQGPQRMNPSDFGGS